MTTIELRNDAAKVTAADESASPLRLDERGHAGAVRYGILCLILLGYVALCTGQRDNNWGTDAWEHHRDIRAIAHNIWRPGNPTYATNDPSPRYSPYIVFWGAVCHFTHLDPYAALSIAAVVNTLLLLVGVRMLLRSFGEQAASSSVLLTMVGLYGGAPGYSGSYALADLPWHQVNPSMFALALTLILWALFLRLYRSSRKPLLAGGILVLGSVVLLSHGLVGGFAILGMLLIAAFVSGGPRPRSVLLALGLAVGIILLCIPWPWYSFLEVARTKPNTGSMDWFNPSISKMAITQWDVPACLFAVAALGLYRRPLVHALLPSGLVMLLFSVVGLATHSPFLGRLPVIAVLLLQIPIGIFIYQSRLFQPGSWPGRLRAVVWSEDGPGRRATVEVMVGLVFLYCLLPQLKTIVQSPVLARAYPGGSRFGKEDKQLRLRQVYAQLLAPIHEGDVVLSDSTSSWPVPSFDGKVVVALHHELLVPGQAQRGRDAEAFFLPTTDEAARHETLARYAVRWIIVNHEFLDPAAINAVEEQRAIVSHGRQMALMDVDVWLAARQHKHGAATGSTANLAPVGGGTKPFGEENNQ